MPDDTTERHEPLSAACRVEQRYEGSDIVHVCRLDHVDSDVHSCACGLIWRDASRDEEVERLRAELAEALKTGVDLAEDRAAALVELDDARAERDALKAAIETGEVARFAADVRRLIGDYSNEERGVIALTPFEATLDQLCLEKYGFDLDKVAALAVPGTPGDAEEATDA